MDNSTFNVYFAEIHPKRFKRLAREIKKHCLKTEETLLIGDNLHLIMGLNGIHAKDHRTDVSDHQSDPRDMLKISDPKTIKTCQEFPFFYGYQTWTVLKATRAVGKSFDRKTFNDIEAEGIYYKPRLWVNKYTSESTIEKALVEQYNFAQKEMTSLEFIVREDLTQNELNDVWFYTAKRFPIVSANAKEIIALSTISSQKKYKHFLRKNPSPFIKDCGDKYSPLVSEYVDNNKFFEYLINKKFIFTPEEYKAILIWALAIAVPAKDPDDGKKLSHMSFKALAYKTMPEVPYENLGVGFMKILKLVENKLFPREILDVREILNLNLDVQNNPEKVDTVREIVREYYEASENLRSNLITSLNFFLEGGFLVKSITGGLYFTTDFFERKKEMSGYLDWSRPGEYLDENFVKQRTKTHGRISRIRPSKAYII